MGRFDGTLIDKLCNPRGWRLSVCNPNIETWVIPIGTPTQPVGEGDSSFAFHRPPNWMETSEEGNEMNKRVPSGIPGHRPSGL
jgi:hypothetical protein